MQLASVQVLSAAVCLVQLLLINRDVFCLLRRETPFIAA
jgi:hypothetical protein